MPQSQVELDESTGLGDKMPQFNRLLGANCCAQGEKIDFFLNGQPICEHQDRDRLGPAHHLKQFLTVHILQTAIHNDQAVSLPDITVQRVRRSQKVLNVCGVVLHDFLKSSAKREVTLIKAENVAALRFMKAV